MVDYSQFVVLIFIFSSFAFSHGATLLPNDEMKTLGNIAKEIGKTDWDFNADPCTTASFYRRDDPNIGFANLVICNCSNTVCHIISIILKGQSLQGVLPIEIVQLPYLKEIDLTRNFLNGSIPPEWGTTNLVNISLNGNRLTGPIPKEIGNISTLESFAVENNQLSGVLPPELGKLRNIRRLIITSNNFSGELPETFANLTTLNDFRISDNQFTGQIPNFIQNWVLIEKLCIQASGMSGPIPSGIGLLQELSDMRISDLSGDTTMTFPPLISLKKLKTFILRSCNVIGQLPDYLGQMADLQTLDLSFNKLSGTIPSTYSSLFYVDNIYLTGNMLSGDIPDWMLLKSNNIDLSYNKIEIPETSGCQRQSVNLFGSSSEGNYSGIVPCLRSFHCPREWYSFHINCGGKQVTIGNKTYEEDRNKSGPSKFYQSKTNWAFSSTGHFLDDNRTGDSYTWTSSIELSSNATDLYMDARLSPISLTYYGFCLGNGNYTVSLQFAEIMFTGGNTYSSLGRRVFDIYIQGVLVLKDFNIANNASGIGKESVKMFPAVVKSNTLEIRFQWAGKGTTGIPVPSVYGPLISAISVNSDFDPPESKSPPPPPESKIVVIVGVVVGVVAVVISLIVAIIWLKGCMRKKTMENDLRHLDLQTGSFTLRQIKAATNNFDPENKIGEGGFGSVYKGLLADGKIIAVKQLSSKSKQGSREFVNEIGMISALQHPHLVKLYGCCVEGKELLLVYEYMENNSLAHALYGSEETQLNLEWKTRQKICIGIARGLAYLHEESGLKIVHRDIKATNILLDKDLSAKISDFGLAKLDEEKNTHISTRIAGTYGYMAPEYAMRGYLTDKADVYSFGVVTLEIVSGRSNNGYNSTTESFYLLDWAHELKKQGKLMELVDPKLGSDYNQEEVMVMISLALLCTNESAAVRPAMSSVVRMLEGKITLTAIPLTPVDSDRHNGMNTEPIQNSNELSMTESQVHWDRLWSVAVSPGIQHLHLVDQLDSH